jgi:polyisoprenoid-binding protein YceI
MTVLVDVLPAEQFRLSRLPRARNACVFEVAFADNVRSLAPDPQTPIVVYGHGGHSRDADVAADKLERLGYRNVRVLAGGRLAWRAASLPLEGEQAVPVETPGVVHLAIGHYTVLADASRISWEGRNPNGAHDGTVELAAGELDVTADAVSGRFEVDLSTIRNADLAGDPSQAVLVEHLKSDDFFFVERFPQAVYRLRAAAPLPDGASTTPNYRVEGDLELRGVTVPLGFDATVNQLSDGRIAVEAHFDVDRTRWGVIYGSARFFAHLGKHVVFDPVSIRLRIVVA